MGKKNVSSSSKFCHFFWIVIFLSLRLPYGFISSLFFSLSFSSVWFGCQKMPIVRVKQTNAQKVENSFWLLADQVLFVCVCGCVFFCMKHVHCCLHEYFINLLICNMYSYNSHAFVYTKHLFVRILLCQI